MDDDQDTQSTSDQSTGQDTSNQSTDQSAGASIGPVEEQVYVSSQDAIPVAPGDVQPAGDYPQDDTGVVLVSDSPHPSVDAQVQYPWTFQVSVIYRNLNLAQIQSLHLDLVHEPNVQLSLDPKGGLSVQSAVTLVNWHWMPPWNREVEVGLSGILNNTIIPKLSTQYGGQLQLEQHIVPWFSITLGATGSYSPPRGGQPGQFGLTGAAGALFHFDGL
jgi:hypothetical protein